jgi:Kef-type K+ transport system membrane component KefB
VFPLENLTVLDTLANMGLLFFLFGLELDPSSLRCMGRTALAITVAGMPLPFSLGVGASIALRWSCSWAWCSPSSCSRCSRASWPSSSS